MLACRPFNHYWQINPDPGSEFANEKKHLCASSSLTNIVYSRCLSSRHIQADHLGLIRRKRRYRYLPDNDTPSNALEFGSEAREEDSLEYCTRYRHLCSHLRYA